jgi:hypothetical protein
MTRAEVPKATAKGDRHLALGADRPIPGWRVKEFSVFAIKFSWFEDFTTKQKRQTRQPLMAVRRKCFEN